MSFDLISVQSMCHYDTIPDFYQLDTVRSSSSQECKQSSIKREKTEQKKNLVLDRNCDPLFQGSINPDTQTTLTQLAPRPRTTGRGAVAENANYCSLVCHHIVS